MGFVATINSAISVLTGYDVALVLVELVLVALLHVLLPARAVVGYVRVDGEVAKYRLNGGLVLIVMVLAWYLAPSTVGVPTATLGERVIGRVVVASAVGVMLSAVVFVVGLFRGGANHSIRTATADSSRVATEASKRDIAAWSTLEQYFNGVEFNPRFWGVDLKMLLYVIGGVGLQLNVLSAAAAQWRVSHDLSGGMIATVVMTTWFVVDYFVWEHVHLWTYDIIAERTGMKLVWGCICFYPYFYAIGAWVLLGHSASRDSGLVGQATIVLLLLVFGLGWALSRGANLQKYSLKTAAWKREFKFGPVKVEQRTVRGSSDRLLCSGWWGISRHVNYVGEVLMAGALAAAATLETASLLPLLYPAYMAALLIFRARSDDAICGAKYGKVWEEYKALVPWRLVPGLY